MRACDEIRRVPSEDNIARTAGGEGRLGFASSSEEGSVSGSWGWVKERTHLSWVGARFNSVQPRAQSQPQVQRFFAESLEPSGREGWRPNRPPFHQGFFDGFNPRRRLPHRIYIISYFAHNACTLLARSLTCYSRYATTVSNFHHLTTGGSGRDRWDSKFQWSGQLRKSCELGLLPLVKRFRIRLSTVGHWTEFTPEWLGTRALCSFLALTNLQELGIDLSARESNCNSG